MKSYRCTYSVWDQFTSLPVVPEMHIYILLYLVRSEQIKTNKSWKFKQKCLQVGDGIDLTIKGCLLLERAHSYVILGCLSHVSINTFFIYYTTVEVLRVWRFFFSPFLSTQNRIHGMTVMLCFSDIHFYCKSQVRGGLTHWFQMKHCNFLFLSLFLLIIS